MATNVQQPLSRTRGRPQKTPTLRTPDARTDTTDALFQQDQPQQDLAEQDPFRQDLAQLYQPQQDPLQQVLSQQDPLQQDPSPQLYAGDSDSYSSQPDSDDSERHLRHFYFYSKVQHWEEEGD